MANRFLTVWSLNEFWDSWQELAKQPDSSRYGLWCAREVRRGLSYNHIGSQINKLQDDINTEIIKRIDEVNEITAKIAELNVTIAKAEVADRATIIAIRETTWWINCQNW